MPSFSHPASPLWVLICMSMALQRSDLRLAYVTHNSFQYYSCSQDPQPCSTSSLTDCRIKEVQSSSLLRSHSHSSPVFSTRRLIVWFTSPVNTAHLLNNSEVRHLTVINCSPRGAPASSLDVHFAVQHLERLTVIKRFHRQPDANPVINTDTQTHNAAHYEKEQDTFLDLTADKNKESESEPSAQLQVQDLHLGREIGAAYHEQARLGVLHYSVLEWGRVVKAYTVQTHINSEGLLPFAKLQLLKLPETSVIYVSFVY